MLLDESSEDLRLGLIFEQMKGLIPVFILLLAATTLVFAFVGSDSYPRLVALREALVRQRDVNTELRGKLNTLRGEIAAIQQDDRGLEKAARNQLGLARPDELILIFDDAKKK